MSGLLGSQDPLLWYVNRSTGLVLLVLLTVTTALGVLTARRAPGPSGAVPRFVPQAVHRSLGLLSLLLLAVHAASAVVDEYVDIRWWHALVPVDLQYRPVWLALGVVASDVLLLAAVTSVVRARLRHRHWRAVHLTTYAAWGAAVVHGLGTGTDNGATPVGWAYVGCGAVVAAALAARLAATARRWSTARRRSAATPRGGAFVATAAPAVPRRTR